MHRADHSSRGVLPSVARLTECDREALVMRRPWPTRGYCATGGKKISLCTYIMLYYTYRAYCVRILCMHKLTIRLYQDHSISTLCNALYNIAQNIFHTLYYYIFENELAYILQ
jgi:hypothetical protein